MGSVLSAAFIVFLGSSAPCPPPCPYGDCMSTYGMQDIVQWIDPGAVPVALGTKVDIAFYQDRAALDKASAETWFGPRCDHGENEYIADVLDVKAGRWFKLKQVRQTTKVTKTVVEEQRTGKLKVEE